MRRDDSRWLSNFWSKIRMQIERVNFWRNLAVDFELVVSKMFGVFGGVTKKINFSEIFS